MPIEQSSKPTGLTAVIGIFIFSGTDIFSLFVRVGFSAAFTLRY